MAATLRQTDKIVGEYHDNIFTTVTNIQKEDFQIPTRLSISEGFTSLPQYSPHHPLVPVSTLTGPGFNRWVKRINRWVKSSEVRYRAL